MFWGNGPGKPRRMGNDRIARGKEKKSRRAILPGAKM